jgi:hypothetical protein
MKISQDQINELASKHGMSPWDVETNGTTSSKVYLDRDIADTSLYNMARVSIPENDDPVVAYCGLYNAKGKVSTDGEKEYSNVELAIKDVDIRFNLLRAPYQPIKKVVKVPATLNRAPRYRQ